jgi:hypothetical protein
MLRAHLIAALLTGHIAVAKAVMLGNLESTSYQICGKGIVVQLAEQYGTGKTRTLIGLKNNRSGNIDLFMSANVTNKQYDKYQPVNFDALSKTFIVEEKGRPTIMWGGTLSSLKEMQYTLTLGSHVYKCNKISQFENEIAYDWYGEK